MTVESTTEVRAVPRIDHVMVLLDADAYRAVSQTGFIGERFGRLKTKAADSSIAGQYSTIGVAGDNTLVELFGADMPSAAPLSGGLVFSFEEPGSSAAARALLDASGEVRYHADLVRRAVAGSAEQQPWYHLISVDLGEASRLLLFLNEVTPEYFAAIGASPAPDGAMRRRDYLDAALGAPADGQRLMRDISAITVVLRAERARRIAAALTALGYTADERDGGWRLRGPDLVLWLRVDESAPERVAEIEIRIAADDLASLPATEFRFGATSRLVIENAGTARWFFDRTG